MTDGTKAIIKSRVEESIVEATADLGPFPARTDASPAQVALPEHLAWALVNVADTRQVFVDNALATLGGDSFAVEVHDDAVVILPAVAPSRGAAPVQRVKGKGSVGTATLSTATGDLKPEG